MSPRSGETRRSRSASPEYDEDPEFLEALRRSKELTSGAGLSEEDKYDEEADLKLALQLQLAESDAHAMQEDAFPLRNTIGFMNDPTRHEDSPWHLDEKQPSFSKYHTEADHNVDVPTLAHFIQHVKSAQCPKCGSLFFRTEHDARKLLLDWKNGSSALTSSLNAAGKDITWCCAGGRLLLLWLLLCGFDEHFSAAKTSELARARMLQNPRPGKKKKGGRGRGGGIGFGGSNRTNMPGGMGYGGDGIDSDEEGSPWSGAGHTLSGHRFDANATNTSGKARALSLQHTEDQFYGLHMQLIEGLLPSFERESSFDFDPPDSVTEMLVESKILAHCAELLRNDSLEDATKRKCVYEPLFGLLRTLGAHYVSASGAIYNERPIREDRVNLVTLSFYEHPGICTERTSSLLHGLGNLATQSEMVLRVAKRNENDFRNEKGEELLILCRQIADLHQYLTANSNTNGKAKSVQSKAEVAALEDSPDQDIFAVHHFSQAAKKIRTYTPGRSRRLITELTTLKTGLPPGIFVRYAESRPDVQKVVIIGPMSTPYENGVFEFDVFCGQEFPNKPPQVQFRTTGGGKVNFNPNLYADGKVCLSLLGTWEARYNQLIREHTVRTATLEWLDKTSSLWKDVLDQHFTANADKILHAAVGWSKSEIKNPSRRYLGLEHDDSFDNSSALLPNAVPGLPPWSVRDDLENMLPRLQKALNKYGASRIVADKPETAVSKGKGPSSERSTTDQGSDQPAFQYDPTPLYSHPSPHSTMGHTSHLSLADFSLYPPSSPGSLGFTGFTGGFSYFSGVGGRGGYRGRGNSSAFAGPGRALGEATPAPATPSIPGPASSSAQSSSTRGRGGSLAGTSGSSPGTGRYETRSSTRGGRGSPGAGSMDGGINSSVFDPSQGPDSLPPPSGRGGYHFAQARSGHGGQGDQGGRGGRGDFGGRGGGSQSDAFQ
ncbi:hypothetical protein DE146DRAFT_715356 [Phaeosphaeria sp. MPI-PUGE-AT-0046c]|nr:hypothetical protein DE146DRAFT_715356 [Phaeosphaeria sp. MPI-PUGE-AT-0046c]